MRRAKLGSVPRTMLLSTALALVLCVGFVWNVRADDSSIARGFQASGSQIATGAIVSLQEGAPDTVELANLSNRTRLVGVAGQDALLEFINGAPVQVITSGTTTALVTDLNGAIKAGDKITASPIQGIGMKATESTTIAGTAQAALDPAKAETRSISTKSGDKRTVHIGEIPLLVAPTFYQVGNSQSPFVPSAFQGLANSVAGRQVSAVRVLIAGLVIMTLLIGVAALVFSGVRASIISIGRNPLSEQVVRKSLFDIGVTTFGILAFTIIIVYLILTT